MNLEKGIKLEIANVFINWGITIQQLSEQLKIEVKNSQNNIYLKNENCLNGLKCNISFHFNEKNELYWISLKRTDYEELSLSYKTFQNKLETLFGKPNSTEIGIEGFENNRWNINNLEIIHSVMDHFGPSHGIGIIKEY